jgi:sulfite reductase beta subunit-like hemoprotein
VGGGLSADPHLAVRLNAFVQQHQVAAVVRKITELFRDQQGLRESRDRARMKHLFLREGWTAETFLADLNRGSATNSIRRWKKRFRTTSTAITWASTGRSRRGSAT